MSALAVRGRQPAGEPAVQAGELLALEALDQTGLAVTSEGALVRYLEVTPPNPLLMGDGERAQTAAGFSRLISRLRPGQSLQFYVETRPVQLEELLDGLRSQVREFAGAPPSGEHTPSDRLALSRWRLYAAMEDSVRRHADQQAAVNQRTVVVVPYLPAARSARELLARAGVRSRALGSGQLERSVVAHRRVARESLAHTDQVRSELEALGLGTRLLNGEEVAELLWRRFCPTRADSGRRRLHGAEIVGELDAPVDAQRAREVAVGLREAIAQAPLDFGASKHHAEIDRDAEQVIYAATTADGTYLAWLLGAMMTRQPYTLSVYVHALDRARERTRLKLSYRRTFAINRGAEAKGRVPDFDRYAQEHESQSLLAEMAGHERARVYRISIYQSLRAPGPEPSLAALAEAVDYCAEQIASASDCKVSRGEFQQQLLWCSSLPLGRDLARRSRKYVTRNVGETLPLIGTGCGSPTGVPFAFSDPGRTLELLNPYDRSHSNQTMLINGQSGSGKTLCANVLLGRSIALGARGFVIDRAGHYAILAKLIDGASEIELGADDSGWAINPWDVPDPGNVSREKVSFLKSLHGVMMGEEGLSTIERAQLETAIRDVYAHAAITGARPRESLLRAALTERAGKEKREGNAELSSLLRNLAERLGEFCGEGSYAHLLDRDTNVPADVPLVVFDTRRCPEEVLRLVMFTIIEYVTRTVVRHRDDARELTARADAPLFAGRSVMLIDEAWHLVGRRETGEYANDLARRARHLGLFLIAISQQMSDFATEYGRALIRNSTMQLLLAQHPDEIGHLQEALHLSDQEAAVIGRLKTVKGRASQLLWINGTRGRGQVSLQIGPLEYWAYTSDPIKDAPAREAAIARRRGDVWAAIGDLARQGSGGE